MTVDAPHICLWLSHALFQIDSVKFADSIFLPGLFPGTVTSMNPIVVDMKSKKNEEGKLDQGRWRGRGKPVFIPTTGAHGKLL